MLQLNGKGGLRRSSGVSVASVLFFFFKPGFMGADPGFFRGRAKYD